jgi:hypothetical protein
VRSKALTIIIIIIVVVVADKSGEKYWFNPPTLFIYSIFIFNLLYFLIFPTIFSTE